MLSLTLTLYLKEENNIIAVSHWFISNLNVAYCHAAIIL